VQSDVQNSSTSSRNLWAGRILSGLAVLFMIFDGVIHILKISPVVEAFGQLGFPLSTAVALGIVELVCVALYAIPRTSVLGAILLTGYLGGAIATQVRIGAPLLSTGLFPVYIALFVWGGLFLRDDKLRALIPLRR
jgi:hypothetical protein